jgi:hypothetical protein
MTVYNAVAFKVKLVNGLHAYVEEQEYYSLLRIDATDTIIVGEYYFPYEGATEFDFVAWDEDNRPTEHYQCQIIAYSHDYGETWTEVLEG